MIILIGLGISLLVFFIGIWFFMSASHKTVNTVPEAKSASKNFTISSKDIETIAGDDVLTTQLDLARAYIETERKKLAHSILNNVMQHGNVEQQQEAKRLLANLQWVS
jgi:FimV-like protein